SQVSEQEKKNKVQLYTLAITPSKSDGKIIDVETESSININSGINTQPTLPLTQNRGHNSKVKHKNSKRQRQLNNHITFV
ncbi:hypothetical protein HHI36_001086, partial [Cryptolaemus montrouzieri]